MFRVLIAATLLFFTPSVQAQDALPTLPAPLQNEVDEGAQIRFLGKDHGFDSWLLIKGGQEQYFYVKPDGNAFLMGVLFNKDGEMVTLDQVQRLRGSKNDSLLDSLAGEDFTKAELDAKEEQAFEFKSPSERLFHDIENSNWVALGKPDAPALYSFIDPQCPHCHSFINDLRNGALEQGQVQLRMIPVGFRDETRAQSAFLMATPNPQERFFQHMDGDADALPARAELNQQGVQRNLAIMQSWKLAVTPLIVYRAADGSVKIIRGRPKDIPSMLADIRG